MSTTKCKICKERDVLAKNCCARCYNRIRNGIIDENGKQLRAKYHIKHTHCIVEGCGIEIQPSGGNKSRGLCSTHNSQFLRGVIDVKGNRLKPHYARTKKVSRDF